MHNYTLNQTYPCGWLFTTSKGNKIGLSNQEKWGVKMHRNTESLCRFYDLHCISCSFKLMTPYSHVMVFMPSNTIVEVGILMGNPKYTYLQLPWIKSPLALLLAPMCARASCTGQRWLALLNRRSCDSAQLRLDRNSHWRHTPQVMSQVQVRKLWRGG